MVARVGVAVEVLLPGEDPESSFIDDIEHWIGVYEQLIEVCARLPRQSRGRVLQGQLRRFRGRLAYWRARTGEAR